MGRTVVVEWVLTVRVSANLEGVHRKGALKGAACLPSVRESALGCYWWQVSLSSLEVRRVSRSRAKARVVETNVPMEKMPAGN